MNWNCSNSILDEALIQQVTIAAMEEPSEDDLEHIKYYLESEDMGPKALTGEDCGTWGTVLDPNRRAPDLISLRPPGQMDAFSRWFTKKAVEKFLETGLYRRFSSKVHGQSGYKESSLLTITHFITSIVASMLPILSITVLWNVKSAQARLGIVACFTLLLTVCLTVLTNASRTEVFAMTNA
jgi:hypothetical protein